MISRGVLASCASIARRPPLDVMCDLFPSTSPVKSINVCSAYLPLSIPPNTHENWTRYLVADLALVSAFAKGSPEPEAEGLVAAAALVGAATVAEEKAVVGRAEVA